MKTNPGLFSKIAAVKIDVGNPAFSFVDRLARENAWPEDFAERVLQEYLRFVYLACVSQEPVTPSIAVDQAWHLHLCYTRSYWGDLCERVLGRPLHHGPTQGGANEDRRYRLQYNQTLRLYEREFGCPAPADIWPSEELRFTASSNPFWATRDRFIILEKTRVRKALHVAGLSLVGLLATGAVASNSGVSGWVFVGIVCLMLLFWWASRNGKGGGGSCGSGCGSGCSSGGHSGCGGDSGCGGGGCGGGGCGGD